MNEYSYFVPESKTLDYLQRNLDHLSGLIVNCELEERHAKKELAYARNAYQVQIGNDDLNVTFSGYLNLPMFQKAWKNWKRLEEKTLQAKRDLSYAMGFR